MPSVATERHELTTHDEVLTLSDAAAYLKLAQRTIHRMISRSEIPCAKVGGQWRFLRSVLDDWLLSRMRVVPQNEVAPLLAGTQGSVRLSTMLDPACVVDPLSPGDPRTVLRQLARVALASAGSRGSSDAATVERLVELLLAREKLSSTALGHGVALPHVRRPQDNPVGAPPIVLGVCRSGTAFDAPDGKPVHLLFLVAAQSELVHLRVLKRITLLFRDEAELANLLEHADSASLIAALAERERALFPGG